MTWVGRAREERYASKVEGVHPGDGRLGDAARDGSRCGGIEHLGLTDAANGAGMVPGENPGQPSDGHETPVPTPSFCSRCAALNINVGRHDKYLPPSMHLTVEEWIT